VLGVSVQAAAVSCWQQHPSAFCCPDHGDAQVCCGCVKQHHAAARRECAVWSSCSAIGPMFPACFGSGLGSHTQWPSWRVLACAAGIDEDFDSARRRRMGDEATTDDEDDTQVGADKAELHLCLRHADPQLYACVRLITLGWVLTRQMYTCRE
jgi:hypothetical protein